MSFIRRPIICIANIEIALHGREYLRVCRVNGTKDIPTKKIIF